MREVFVMNKEMHMGPVNRTLKVGDVLSFEPEMSLMTLNGSPLPDDGRHKSSRTGFAETARVLKRQAIENPDAAWASIRITGTPESVFSVKTETLAVLPVLGCLKASEDFLGEPQYWAPVNERQTEFLEHFIEHIETVDKLGGNLVRKADQNIDVINAFLAENGFPELKLTVQPGRDGFCVASVLDVLCEWLAEGTACEIREYDGVRLKDGVCAFFEPETHQFPVVKIRAKNGDLVCMSICGPLGSDKYAIHWKVEALRAIKKPYDCEGVMFPMVSYESMIDISFLVGLRTSPDEPAWSVAEAIQKTRFKMNLKGCRAQSAAAMAFRCCSASMPKQWVRIDKPFILWIERNGIAIPLFEGVFAEDVWKNPGGLE